MAPARLRTTATETGPADSQRLGRTRANCQQEEAHHGPQKHSAHAGSLATRRIGSSVANSVAALPAAVRSRSPAPIDRTADGMIHRGLGLAAEDLGQCLLRRLV